MEFYIGQIIMFGGNFAIRNLAECNGQLLAISQYSALFSILGTTYGGDGRTTFALPDLRGRSPIHMGNGPGLTPRPLGQKSGEENVTLNMLQIPSHNHTLIETTAAGIGTTQEDGTTNIPSRSVVLSTTDPATNIYAPAANVDDTLGGFTQPQYQMGMTGGNQSHNNMQPYLVINYQIALQGIFPSRN